MTSIDCLLKNTEIIDAIKPVVEYLGTKRASEDKPASLETIYEELRKAGVEIDLGSAAHIYQDVLSSKDHPSFNTREEVNEKAGKYFDDLQRGLILRQDKTGEQQISELSPAQAAVKALTRAFTSPLIKDERTKSILKTMQDSYTQWAKKMAGPAPDDISGKKDTRNFEQIIQDALDKESLGYSDKTTGALIGFTKLHEGAKEIMKKLGAEVDASGDETLKAQWDQYAKSIENATRTLMLSTAEGKKVLHEALMTAEGGGYIKESKSGNQILDHQKLAGEVDSIAKYRENVINALTASGFSKDEAERASDVLQKEYHELRGKSLEILRNEQIRKEKTNEPKEAVEKVPVGDIVRNAIKRNEAYKKQVAEAAKEGVDISDHEPRLTFSKTDGNRIMVDALKNSEYGKTSDYTGKTDVDWTKLSMKEPNPIGLELLIRKHLEKNEGISPIDAHEVATNLIKNGMHDKLMDDIDKHSENKLTSQGNLLNKEVPPVNKSKMTQLAELHSMGIFSGAHDDLMHNVLGIDATDQQARKDLINLFEKQQQLVNRFGGQEFLHHSMTALIQADVNRVIERSIADKGRLSKIAKAIYDYQNFVNMGIIANPYNIAENTISGYMANAGQTVGIFKQMGSREGLKLFYEMNRIWAATLRDVAKGGVHYGMESGKFTQSSAASDKLTFKNWDKLNPTQKVLTVLLSYAHLGLNAMDSAYKASMHQKTTILNLHKALTELPDASGVKMTRDEANEYINEHIFGKSLDKARTEAESIYKQIDIKPSKDMIERSARELVAANIFSDGRIDKDVIEAAMDGAYHVASVGLGHEARKDILGFSSRVIKKLQTVSTEKYDELIKQGRYDAAAMHHIVVQSMIVNGAFKFAHGVANWMVLRPLTSGLGLITGGISKKIQKSDLIDYNDKRHLSNAFTKQAQANADINRSYVGLAMLGAQAGATMLYGLLNEDKNKKKGALGSGFEAIKKNPIANKMMNKFGSDVLALMYSSYTAKKSGGGTEQSYANLQGFQKYVQGLTNVGQGYSFAERSAEMSKDLYRGGKENNEKAAGIGGELLKQFLVPAGGELPFYRSAKGAYYIGKSIAQNKAQLPPFFTPRSVWQGIFDNGVNQDIQELFGGDPYKKGKGLPIKHVSVNN